MNRGVYSFCMCPGGYVVNASSEDNRLSVNGMSYSKRDSGVAISAMRCDGGAVVNGFLMQFQSDLLDLPIHIPQIRDTTALGSAFMAALGAGHVSSTEELRRCWQLAAVYTPQMDNAARQDALSAWHRAVERCRDWAR